MTDYRISIEELESQAEIAEMARNLLKEVFSEESEDSEKEIPTRILIKCSNSWGKLTEEEIKLPF